MNGIFGWGGDDWPRLAGASTAGHLIECGAQATGGLWSGWADLPDLAGLGYPVAAIAQDGSFAITKPPGTGGRVSVGMVTEQLFYEIDDPSRYRTLDVDLDFTGLSMTERVRPCGGRRRGGWADGQTGPEDRSRRSHVALRPPRLLSRPGCRGRVRPARGGPAPMPLPSSASSSSQR
jgi:acyclic terpene utilization AtuA family protein